MYFQVLFLCWIISRIEAFLDPSIHNALVYLQKPEINSKLAILNNDERSPMEKSVALYDLGMMYLYGNESVMSNYTIAIDAINASAAIGNPNAQFIMGIAYTNGFWSVPKDDAKAVLNFYFASLSGNTAATMVLAYRHYNGITVPTSCETSVLYYDVAAKKSIALRQNEQVTKIGYDQRPPRLSTLESGSRSGGPKDTDIVDYYRYTADKGDSDSMLSLATLYYYGARSVKQDLRKAATYFHKALDMGASAAAANLGHMYAHGLGVKQDNETAFRYFQEAAHEGNAAAQNGLGYMYLYGFGEKHDVRKAMKHLKKSAQQGNSEALYNLGVVYMGSTGESPDYAAALHHFQAAAQQSHTLAMHKLGYMHLHGIGTSRSCENAMEYFKSVSERGPWVTALREAAQHYKKGRYDAAFVIYTIMAEQGYEVAQHNAAWMIDNGYGYRGDDHGDIAVRLHKHAANQGNIEANLKIGDYYYYGKGGLPVDYDRATSHYREAAKRNNAQAMFNLGMMHELGIGLSKDLYLAKRWYDMAENADKDAHYPVLLSMWRMNVRLFLENLKEKAYAYIEWLQHLWDPSEIPMESTEAPSESVSVESSPTEASSPALELNYDITLDGDSLLIIGLSATLCFVVYYRNLRNGDP